MIESVYIQDYWIGCCACCTPLMGTKFLNTSFKDLLYFLKNIQRAKVFIHGCEIYRNCFFIELKIIESIYIQDYWIGCSACCTPLMGTKFFKTSFKDLSYFVRNILVAQLRIHGCKNYRDCFLKELKMIESVYFQDYWIGCCACCTPLVGTKFLKTSFKDLSYFVRNIQGAQVRIHGCKNYRHCFLIVKNHWKSIYSRLLNWMLCLLYPFDKNQIFENILQKLFIFCKKYPTCSNA